MVLDVLWYTILRRCILSFVIVGKVQNHELGKAVKELSITKCVSRPEQSAGLLGVLCDVNLTSGPVVHGAYALQEIFGLADVRLGVDRFLAEERDGTGLLNLTKTCNQDDGLVRMKISWKQTYIVLISDDSKLLELL